MGVTRELKYLRVSMVQEEKVRQEITYVKLRNIRIVNSRALGVSRPSQLSPDDLAFWRARIQSQINVLIRRCMEIKVRQALLVHHLCRKEQILVDVENLRAIIFLKQNSEWNGSAKVLYEPEEEREKLETELTRNEIPVIISNGPLS